MPSIHSLAAAIVNGIMTGAIYALVAVGLTLVYGVLHIINFAHGAILSVAMFAAFLCFQAHIDPYLAMLPLTVLFFSAGYLLQRYLIGPASHGEDGNILLVTLGLSIVIENLLLAAFRSDTRTIDVPYAFTAIDLGFTFLPLTRLMGLIVAMLVAGLLWLLLNRSDTGRAIRAVAREKLGATLVGVDVAHIYGVTFGLGAACLAVAACLLLPIFYVNPRVGEAYVLVAFTIVVLGGMGSIAGAFLGGIIIGVVESLSGMVWGESLGQLGIFVIFILVLLLRPTGLFGARA